ncbi:MAG: DUF1963 domain-containing protein [Shimia sp.]|jgi:uncharacterized protein YwqG|uniref:DUF1963 domain-containing protein n=2 Tax=unclassified Shimia TaxID=2630038 RepID=UPI0025E6B14C|nr:DUF1963 domain-containing protein [Shimia sp.]MCH2066469.1 DUF1963 domain-containing protein [Shimia sp.]
MDDFEAQQREWQRIPTREEMENRLKAETCRGVQFYKTVYADTPGAPGCWIGGEPTLPPDIDWPTYTEDDLTVPMHFLGQINLAEVAKFDHLPEMPTTGTLFFFYDTIYAPVSGTMGQQGSQVIYVPEDVSVYPPRPTPRFPTIETEYVSYWYLETPTQGYAKWNVQLRDFEDYNYDFDNEIMDRELSSHHWNVITALHNWQERRFNPAENTQNRASSVTVNTMFGGRNLKKYADTTRLFSIGADPDIGFEHAGKNVCFWINPKDLRLGRFDASFAHEEE